MTRFSIIDITPAGALCNAWDVASDSNRRDRAPQRQGRKAANRRVARGPYPTAFSTGLGALLRRCGKALRGTARDAEDMDISFVGRRGPY